MFLVRAVALALLCTGDELDELTGRDDRVDHWRADVAFLAKELTERHKNLFFAQPREEFEARVAELDEAIERLEDHEIIVELMRITTSVGDGHTALWLGAGPMPSQRLPVEFHKFPDGLRVVLAPRDQAALLGARVVAVGAQPFDEAWRRVGETISHDNEYAVAAYAPEYFEAPFVLHALGLGRDLDHAAFRLALEDGPDDGKEQVVELAAEKARGAIVKAEAEQEPLWRQRRGETYWWTFVPETKLLYLQYNQCTDDRKRPFATLCQELFAAVDEHDVDRFVVDLRHNSGGDSGVILPLYAGLGARRKLRGRGQMFVAIGGRTASSAMWNALEMKRGYGALLVGEPTGGKPNAYGEVRMLELPHSKLRVGYSTKYWERMKDDPIAVMPDVAAPITYADWTSGRDPAIEAALAWKQ